MKTKTKTTTHPYRAPPLAALRQSANSPPRPQIVSTPSQRQTLPLLQRTTVRILRIPRSQSIADRPSRSVTLHTPSQNCTAVADKKGKNKRRRATIESEQEEERA